MSGEFLETPRREALLYYSETTSSAPFNVRRRFNLISIANIKFRLQFQVAISSLVKFYELESLTRTSI